MTASSILCGGGASVGHGAAKEAGEGTQDPFLKRERDRRGVGPQARIPLTGEREKRHLADGDRIALYWEGVDGNSSVHTFADLKDGAARFANFLKAQGVGPGDRVAVMLPRIPELMVAALGVWRAGTVYTPMFTAFGPKAIEYRLERSAAKLIVIDPANRPKLDDVANAPPILVVVRAPNDVIAPGDLNFHDEIGRAHV